MALACYAIPVVSGPSSQSQCQMVYVADVEATDLPTTQLWAGNLCFCKDTGKLLKRTDAGTWADAGSGGGGAAAWGTITGTLSSQADLQTALNDKAAASHNHDATYAPISHTHAGIAATVKKTADQTFNTATPANVTGLSFALTLGVYYYFKFLILHRSPTATVGVKFTCTVPAFTTFGGLGRALIAADGVGAEWQGAMTSSGDQIVPTSVPAVNTDYVSVLEGTILPSANGTLQLQAANETGTTVVTVRQGSAGLLFVL